MEEYMARKGANYSQTRAGQLARIQENNRKRRNSRQGSIAPYAHPRTAEAWMTADYLRLQKMLQTNALLMRPPKVFDSTEVAHAEARRNLVDSEFLMKSYQEDITATAGNNVRAQRLIDIDSFIEAQITDNDAFKTRISLYHVEGEYLGECPFQIWYYACFVEPGGAAFSSQNHDGSTTAFNPKDIVIAGYANDVKIVDMGQARATRTPDGKYKLDMALELTPLFKTQMEVFESAVMSGIDTPEIEVVQVVFAASLAQTISFTQYRKYHTYAVPR